MSQREPSRDVTEDAELQAMLRKRVFALADKGEVDFDALLQSVLASLPNTITAKPTDGDYV
jgi:hypothetical protein